MNAMPEINRAPLQQGDWSSSIQIHGTLLKRPLGHQSNNWSRRFFMVKDGFLIYYPENEKKEFDKRVHFNVHPKGIIPLAECEFKAIREPGHPFAFQVESPEIRGRLILAGESDYERKQWMETMVNCRRVTWKNTCLADEMIKRLESQGLEMAREKQNYFDRLVSEVNALSEEKIRTEELARVNTELEKEKEKLEKFTEEIREEYAKLKDELDDTSQIMTSLDEDRQKLSTLLSEQQSQLQELEKDKEKILQDMKNREKMASQLSKEKKRMSDAKNQLHQQLLEIENKQEELLNEKLCAEAKIKENQEAVKQMEEEKQTLSEHAQELQSTIKDLVVQKELTETELRDEIKARIAAELRLKEAEMSLNKLDTAVNEKTSLVDAETKEEMAVNVKKLKQFFEDLAEEAKFAADKPIIMRNAVYARKTMARRAKTLKFERRKRSTRCQTQIVTMDISKLSSSEKMLRRSLSNIDHSTRERIHANSLTDVEETF
ncbi:pleckstrin homology domain-containing family D member 1 isoform X1 [Patella vulgata]|uniref:pleckstrin homology domain-containing family D member 1 isoform X1 n=1 Tax=Patella vulgata TaxID=6465 RepID=UPI00217FADC3|nr:pleckstrin homology domain-containing family D member 1 isoform X1 [Patella vulgata]